ncbi:uncharacterized protein EI97DRAFT_461922 [Westerdykella ornata]|uniref:dual-specificity kinase n=1 Tax=Westerdykella ornata TaxID=318751 RepID=A0A6A6J8L0_WESOR|nr:uncharacterized protein EI97DRAFT_461922 [Westerdykella ornata]KAF2272534.1 hypothetical protein EI97DRAFT_461922 [Westerdykella ornata]
MAAHTTRIPPTSTGESSLPIRPTNSAANDSSASGEMDGPTRRKFPRTLSGNDNTNLRKASTSSTTSAPRPPQNDSTKSGFRGRRLSVRDQHKGPLGPRPLDTSKQRVASNASIASQHVPSAANRSFLPTSTSETVLPESSRAANPRFSFGKHNDNLNDSTGSSAAYDFLPSVNFDDFHASIAAYEPALSDFPAPGSGGIGLFPTTVPATQALLQTSMGSDEPISDVVIPSTGTGTRPARSTTLMRRFSQSRTHNSASPVGTSGGTSSMPPPPAGASVRSRRQSHLPAQAPPNPAARAPRKSIGPGMVPSGLDGRDVRNEIPKLNGENVQVRIGRTPSFSQGGRRDLPANLNARTEAQRVSSNARATKAKSMHAPPKQQGFLSAATSTPEHQAEGPITQNRTPGKTPAQRTHTPSTSSSRRQSTMHHVSGLGARTISPTDALRMKRLSMNPNAMGVPAGPPTPQGEFSFDERGLNQSPAMIFRKSVTPSSARGTPEQKRKSYASGISLSSNSSLNSLKVTTSSMLLRGNPALSGSRLPTPKPRNVHSSAAGEDDEDVPPVPAIPKAYESPKDPDHTSFSFLAATKSSMPQPSRQHRAPTPDLDSGPDQNTETSGSDPNTTDPTKKEGPPRHRRGLTLGSSDVDKTPVLPRNTKKNLQPIRLPPLTLLPLGTPFNNRISSFPAPSSEVDDRSVTPPPKRASNKTPSTPMTASKATFFSKSHPDPFDTKHLRSSSSAYNLRRPDSSLPAASAMPVPTLNPGRQATTPFASNSLPKGGGDFARLYSRPSGEYQISDLDVEMQSLRVNGPRAQPKTEPSSAHTTSTEPETPSSASSLRRKLSISGWRRSSSKAATHVSHGSQSQNIPRRVEQTQQPQKPNDMPPPRLPASAAWNGSLGGSPTPSNRTRPSLDFSRRKPSTATIASDTELDKHGDQQKSKISVRIPSSHADLSGNKPGASLLTPVQRMLGSKSSTSVLRARHLESNLDREDLAADEEMRKLASKRRSFEQAARQVDELRKRARPQERVTPAQALQMVNLNIFERGEIIDYKEIYFCGTKNAKKIVGDLSQQALNFGYDDERGDYNIVLGDHLAYRYEVVDVLGKGSFGQVVRCVDHKMGLLVAVKIIRNKKRFHQQALVEVNILKKLREWDPDNKHSMINFTQSFYFRGHLCISTELLGMNLYEFIKAHEFKGFSLRLIRRFSKQILSSLILLRSHRVIHCDLKPENILLAHPLHSEIKVIDFGSSCFENEKVYTYIQSRFYRSPEVILGMSYGLPIDMWSLGCILAELLTGYPIFPGENEQEQLACIMEIFGPPEKHLIEKSSRRKLFFDSTGKPRVTVSSKGRRRRPSSKTLQQALKCDDEAFLDFIARCLRWDPDRRMKPDEAMLHEFITGNRKPARPRTAVNGSGAASSPMKRLPPAQTPQQRTRPLPEPPVTSLRNGQPANTNVEGPRQSPVKGPRRNSTVHGAPSATAVKRAANGAPLHATSSLPRAAQRSFSGKPDLASAAAVASLQKQPR